MTIGRRLEALDLQVRFGRERLQTAQQIADILFFGQHGAQLSSRTSSSPTCRRNSGSCRAVASPLLISDFHRVEARLLGGERGLDVLHVVPVEAAHRRDGDDEEDADLSLP